MIDSPTKRSEGRDGSGRSSTERASPVVIGVEIVADQAPAGRDRDRLRRLEEPTIPLALLAESLGADRHVVAPRELQDPQPHLARDDRERERDGDPERARDRFSGTDALDPTAQLGAGEDEQRDPGGDQNPALDREKVEVT
jgi:hypothetical protein